jgi:glycerol-3-phosphate cytidylyltransferase-like family protein
MKCPNRVVFVAALADLCHRGHINLFKKMKERAGDSGITCVVLHDDESSYQLKDKIPIQNIDQRKENLRITGLIDVILVCHDTDPSKQFEYIIRQYADAKKIYMRGDDQIDFPGRMVLEKNKVAIEFVPYTTGVSSSLIRQELQCQS